MPYIGLNFNQIQTVPEMYLIVCMNLPANLNLAYGDTDISLNIVGSKNHLPIHNL